MSGYTYFGILDHDEFLIPSRNRSLKQMMASINIKTFHSGGLFHTIVVDSGIRLHILSLFKRLIRIFERSLNHEYFGSLTK